MKNRCDEFKIEIRPKGFKPEAQKLLTFGKM